MARYVAQDHADTVAKDYEGEEAAFLHDYFPFVCEVTGERFGDLADFRTDAYEEEDRLISLGCEYERGMTHGDKVREWGTQ